MLFNKKETDGKKNKNPDAKLSSLMINIESSKNKQKGNGSNMESDNIVSHSKLVKKLDALA